VVAVSREGQKAAGDYLRRARRTAGLTQEELASKTGLSVRAISDLERGLTARPRRSSLQLLTDALELPEDTQRELLTALGGVARAVSVSPGHRIDASPGPATESPDSTGAGQLSAGLYRITPVDPHEAGSITSPDARPPAQLPASIPDFTGRAQQVKQLCTLLASPPQGSDCAPDLVDISAAGAVRVVLVVGTGGLGKTTLAVHAAHQVARHFPDGQLYASLRGATHPVDSAEVLGRFLRDLGVDGTHVPADLDERTAMFRTRVAGRRVLIVLDDARDAAQVGPLLPGSATCAVLATSRNYLPELTGAHIVDLDVLDHEEARVLFARVAGALRVRAEPEATGRVLTACAGLPLAIRIAGARLAKRGAWSVAALAERLADERQRLDELRAGNLAVRASFEVSFAALTERTGPGGLDPTCVFRLLGLWTGASISLPAAAALAGEPEHAVVEALDALVDAHLLESPEPDEYRFHDLLRVYASARAREQETQQNRRAAVGRLLTWYLHTTEAAAKVIAPPYTRVPLEEPPSAVSPLEFTSPDEALAWCESKRASLLEATKLAAEYKLHEVAWKLPAAATSFYYRRIHWNDWVRVHQIGLASARILGKPHAEAWMLNNLGMAYSLRRMEESIPYLLDAMAIRRQQGDMQGESRSATNVANAFLELGRFAEAQQASQRALALNRSLGDRYGEGLASAILGSSCRELGQFGAAIKYLQQALSISRELGAQNSEADSLSDLGATYLSLGESSNAIECLQNSLAIWQRVGGRHGEAMASMRLGHAYASVGATEAARQYLGLALDLFNELGDRARSAEVQSALAGRSEAG
jgi:tetratricopeptide (TPR) repeat protein/transcriptional regulator with XRE-family HTH domain